MNLIRFAKPLSFVALFAGVTVSGYLSREAWLPGPRSAVTGASVMGGLSAAWARRVQMAGCVVDGAVRDVGSIREEGVQVWSRGITPVSGKHRVQAIEINGTVALAGLVVRPGDVIAADDTGVCAFPAGHLEAVRDIVMAAEEAEGKVTAAISGGRSLEEVAQILRPERW